MSRASKLWRAVLAGQRFIRFAAFGFTAMLPVLGAASVVARLSVGQILGLLGVALAYHSFSYVHNDVIDLPIDRSQPLRHDDLLVRGVVSSRQALAVALAQLPFALLITFALGGGVWAYCTLLTAFALMAAYNLWGKRTHFPPATDIAQGMGWGALVVYGAFAVGAQPGATTWALCLFVVLYIVLLNGVPGSLRDLANDLACGMCSTAILLGARPRDAEHLNIPTRLVIYTALLQAALTVALLWPLAVNTLGYGVVARWATLIIELWLAWRTSQLLLVITSSQSDRQTLGAAVKNYIFFSLAAPFALFVAALEPHTLALLTFSCIAPLLPTEWWAGHMRQARARLGLSRRA